MGTLAKQPIDLIVLPDACLFSPTYHSKVHSAYAWAAVWQQLVQTNFVSLLLVSPRISISQCPPV